MDGSFANQVLAQIHLYEKKFADNPNAEVTLTVLPKKLDEEVARLHLEKIGVRLEKLTQAQADYLGIPVDGPYKPDHYRY